MKMSSIKFALFMPGLLSALLLVMTMMGGSTSFAAAPAEVSKPHERNHQVHDLDTSIARSLRTHRDAQQHSTHERIERSEKNSQEHHPRKHEQEKSPIGIWERQGYGDVYEIRADGASLFQITRANCVKAEDFPLDFLAQLLTNIEVAENGKSFTSSFFGLEPNFRLAFRRAKALPEACTPGQLITDATPRRVFEVLWHTFNDYYAFFNERGVDWQQRYTDFQARFTDTMDEPALWTALTELLSVIKDGHVGLASNDQEFSADAQSVSLAILEDAFAAQSQYTDLTTFIQAKAELYFATRATRYLDGGTIKQAGEGIVEWGTINGDIGYLSIAGMSSLTPSGDTQSDLLAIPTIMDQVMTDLSGTRAMIIDVRFNGGGSESVSMLVANRFADQRRLAMTRTARSYKGETAAQPLYLEPEGDAPYLKPVVVIAGADTASAAETFLLAMRALPQVTLIGETSRGIFSGVGKKLPNGWFFSISNEVYRDHLGVGHEAVGIPPEAPVSVFSMADLDAGRNSALDKALELVGSPVP